MILSVKARRGPLVLVLMLASRGAPAANLPWTPADAWRLERRGTATFDRASAALLGKMALWKAQEFGDFELRCRAMIGEGVKDGAVWVRFRYRGEHEHYALALRGWPTDDLLLYRFGPGGGDRTLAREPLGFSPVAGKLYDLRVLCVGPEILVFLGEEREPRIRVTDAEPIAAGLVGVGGGYRQAVYDDLQVETKVTSPGPAPDGTRQAREMDLARARQRPALRKQYRPVGLAKLSPGRQVVSLGGTWLFLPDQERHPGHDPRDPRTADAAWHAMEVPAFWTPVHWWCYTAADGASDLWVQRERDRMAALSFNPEKTHAGWYRHWIEIPKSYQAKRIALQFDAVAMACAVWFNGRYLGGHAGMFAPFEVELPADAIRYNSANLLTVLVTDGAFQTNGDAAQLLGPEAAAQLTPAWLSDLPRGMYGPSAGIWQPVRLVATSPLHLSDVFTKPALDGFDAEVSLAGPPIEHATVRATVTDPAARQQLVQTSPAPAVVGAPVTLSAHGLKPTLWSPDAPYLYSLTVDLLGPDGSVLDTDRRAIGFRTFGVEGNRLLLNGRPYWLRGAGYPPSALAPNSSEIARAFLSRMHEGNEVIARVQGGSFTDTWLQAADEKGVGLSVEGVWPWVMINDTPPPAPESVDVWQSEWSGVMRKLRSHPSVLMWTLNSESLWFRARLPELRKQKWAIATRLLQATRQLDPTRPVVCDSGYVRDPQVYEGELKPNGFDDGDVDDAHWYYGWYAPSPWQLYPEDVAGVKPPVEQPFSGTRPAISQECSAGYPGTDTGHPVRKYVDQHDVAQAWVGDYAYPDRDPSIFLSRHAWLTKETIELARRYRRSLCGLLSFCNTTWFRFPYDPSHRARVGRATSPANALPFAPAAPPALSPVEGQSRNAVPPRDADATAEALEPYPVYEAARAALAPVLVSADLRQRHFYAGDTLRFRAYIVNDSADGAALPTTNVEAQLVTAAGAPLAGGAVQLPPVPHYEVQSAPLTLKAPTQLPVKERAEYTLTLRLKAGEKLLAENR